MLSKQEAVQLREEIAGQDVGELARLFAVLGDETRWRLFRLLLKHNDLCVSDLATVVGVSVPAVSQQLRILEMGGLVVRQREGQKICYQVQKQRRGVRLLTRLVAAWRKD